MARTSKSTKKEKFTTPFAKVPLPPDLDDMNHSAAKQAYVVIERFRRAKGLQHDEAMNSLLHGFMHLCDRDTRYGEFDDRLFLAELVYEEGTRKSNKGFKK